MRKQFHVEAGVLSFCLGIVVLILSFALADREQELLLDRRDAMLATQGVTK
jgi:hypothetical protein